MYYFLSSPSTTSATRAPVFKVATDSDLEGASEGSPTPSFVLKKDKAVMPQGPRADFTTHHRASSGPRGADFVLKVTALQSRSEPVCPLHESRSPQRDAREGRRKRES